MANVGKGVAIARLASAKIPSLQELLVSLESFRACLSVEGVNIHVDPLCAKTVRAIHFELVSQVQLGCHAKSLLNIRFSMHFQLTLRWYIVLSSEALSLLLMNYRQRI